MIVALCALLVDSSWTIASLVFLLKANVVVAIVAHGIDPFLIAATPQSGNNLERTMASIFSLLYLYEKCCGA
jgi:hypothetical protein